MIMSDRSPNSEKIKMDGKSAYSTYLQQHHNRVSQDSRAFMSFMSLYLYRKDITRTLVKMVS